MRARFPDLLNKVTLPRLSATSVSLILVSISFSFGIALLHEWDVMMTIGTLFPDLEPRAVRKTTAPVLLLSGAKSYPFLGLITLELARLLPKNQSIVVSDAGHQMWYQHPDECRKFVEEFLAQNGVRQADD